MYLPVFPTDMLSTTPSTCHVKVNSMLFTAQQTCYLPHNTNTLLKPPTNMLVGPKEANCLSGKNLKITTIIHI